MIVLSDMLLEHQLVEHQLVEHQQGKRTRTVPQGPPPTPPPTPTPPPAIVPTSSSLGLDFDSRLLNIELVGGRLVVEADPSFVILLLIILLLLK